MQRAKGQVRTVTGDRDPDSLGMIDYHEHLFHRSPILPGEALDDETAATAEFAELLGAGFQGLIDATPIGLGRRPAALARIAHSTNGVVVASTGRHRDAHYADGWSTDESQLAAIFERELTEGIAVDDASILAGISDVPRADALDAPVRAGLIKLGIGYWSISRDEAAALHAAATAHGGTGAPIMVHTEYASACHELLDILAAAGVGAHMVALAHVDRNPDPVLHAELAGRGAYLGYDGAARYRDWPESTILDAMAAVVAAGHGDRLLVGGDVARRSRVRALGGMPGMAYLGQYFVPRLRSVVGEDALHHILVENPARYLSWRFD